MMTHEDEDAPLPRLTKAEALRELHACARLDGEQGHERADLVLVRLIDDEDIRRAFLALTRWYG